MSAYIVYNGEADVENLVGDRQFAGLGRKIVEAALEAGDSVVATARKPGQLKELTEQYGYRVPPVAPWT